MGILTRVTHEGNLEQWCSRHNKKEGAWLSPDLFHKGNNQYCKTCRSDYFKENYDPEKARGRNFRYYYKHDEIIYSRLLEIQNGVCAICGSPPVERPMGRKRTMRSILSTDHNHKTGKVRGLLCQHCNFTLGWMRDNPDSIDKIVAYLENDGINIPLI